jgi:hypothetical protein
MSNEASEIRIRLAHVLQRWQLERAGLVNESPVELGELDDLETSLSLLEAAPGNERWKELAIVQGNLLGALRRQLACIARDMLSQHIEELKQALPLPCESGGCLDVIVAGGGGATATHACETCGATLALLVEPGEPSLMFCMSCQPEVMASLQGTDPDELAGALVRSFLPTPGSIQHFARPRAVDLSEPWAPGDDIPATAAADEARFKVYGSGGGEAERFKVYGGGSGYGGVRALRSDELDEFAACVRFCQREPLPANDKETEHRLQEARERWPAMMELIGSGWPQ